MLEGVVAMASYPIHMASFIVTPFNTGRGSGEGVWFGRKGMLVITSCLVQWRIHSNAVLNRTVEW